MNFGPRHDKERFSVRLSINRTITGKKLFEIHILDWFADFGNLFLIVLLVVDGVSSDSGEEREIQKNYWKEHSVGLSVEAMMLDSKAADLDKEERPEVISIELLSLWFRWSWVSFYLDPKIWIDIENDPKFCGLYEFKTTLSKRFLSGRTDLNRSGFE